MQCGNGNANCDGTRLAFAARVWLFGVRVETLFAVETRMG